MIKKETYEELHTMLFQMLMEVLRVCKESKLTFYLGGETLLGAYLFQDFLPNAYQGEILMPRKDYEIFRILLSTGNMLSRLYILEDKTTDPHYPEGFCRIRGRLTSMDLPRFEKQGLENKGIFIDVRPLDESSTGEMTKLIRYSKRVARNEEWISLKVAPKDYQKECAGPFTRFLSHFQKKEKLFKKRKKLEAWPLKKNKKATHYLDLYSPYLFRDSIYPIESFKGNRTIPFRGWEFPTPSDIESYLRTVFGDYRNRDYNSPVDENLAPSNIDLHLKFF